ncbi:protein-disulfide reductase DsbD [Pectobacterium actinidiae]|uniref:protein-disulfide reductase DsbD n=1 Tax=Pectobacterium actinidiae TaxID=1507808 RepID=UPI00380D10A7
MLFRRGLLILVLLCSAIGAAWGSSGLFSSRDENKFLDASEVFTPGAVQRQGEWLEVEGHIAKAYYVYRHSLRLTDGKGHDVSLDLPPGTPRHDEFFGDTEIYAGVPLRLRFPAGTAGPATLHWQGCAEAGICYPPQTVELALPLDIGGAVVVSDQPATAMASVVDAGGGPATVADDQAAAQRLASLGPAAGMLLFFGLGLLLAFTPCTLPMIPIVSTMVVGSQAKPRRAFALSLSYVLAMAGTYAVVGVAAGLAGANLQATLQSPWLLGAFAALFLVLAASLFGMFELRLPSALVNRVEAVGRNRSGGSVAGAAALGFLSALLVGPCMTAPLAGALLYISQTGSAVTGGLALFALGLGMGLPLLVIAVFGARILPRPGAWMDRVRVAFGYVMAGMAIMMLARFLPATVNLLLWGGWGLAIAVGLIAWAWVLPTGRRLTWWLGFGAVLTSVWSVLMLVGAASGGGSVLRPLAHLRAEVAAASPASVSYVAAKSVEDVEVRIAQAGTRGQWTLIDFYADWCVSCHVIERTVFGDPSVAARLARMQVVRPDVTRNDATDQALLKRWGVLGPPTLVLIAPDGSERRGQRVVGEVDARGFLDRLDAAGAP